MDVQLLERLVAGWLRKRDADAHAHIQLRRKLWRHLWNNGICFRDTEPGLLRGERCVAVRRLERLVAGWLRRRDADAHAHIQLRRKLWRQLWGEGVCLREPKPNSLLQSRQLQERRLVPEHPVWL